MLSIGFLLETLAKTGEDLVALKQGTPSRDPSHIELSCPWEAKGTIMRRMSELYRDTAEFVEGVKQREEDGYTLVLPDRDRPVLHIYSSYTTEEREHDRLSRHRETDPFLDAIAEASLPEVAARLRYSTDIPFKLRQEEVMGEHTKACPMVRGDGLVEFRVGQAATVRREHDSCCICAAPRVPCVAAEALGVLLRCDAERLLRGTDRSPGIPG